MTNSSNKLTYYAQNRESNKIIEISQSKLKHTNPDEYVECKICTLRSTSLIGHITRTHKMKLDDYRKQYNTNEINCEKYLHDLSKRVSGENNPAYQHGGKFSPFSEKYIHADKNFENVNESKRKAAQARIDNESNSTNIEYWLKKTEGDEIEAKRLLSDRQTTFSLRKCVAKHGIEKGPEIWEQRQEKWQNTLNSKSDEEKSEINRKKLPNIGRVSKNEKSIIDALSQHVAIETQFSLPRTDIKNKHYFYDIKHKNKIIEYNGDFWHANPNVYDKDHSFNRNGKTYNTTQINEKDDVKIQLAKDSGYDVLIVWEKDYNQNKQKVIDECLTFLKQ